MTTIEIEGKTIEFDGEGYLVSFEDWNEAVGSNISKEYQITLTEEHFAVIQIMRDYYAMHEDVPTSREFVKLMAEKLGADKGTTDYFNRLFQYEPLKQCAKISGLPQLRGCM